MSFRYYITLDGIRFDEARESKNHYIHYDKGEHRFCYTYSNDTVHLIVFTKANIRFEIDTFCDDYTFSVHPNNQSPSWLDEEWGRERELVEVFPEAEGLVEAEKRLLAYVAAYESGENMCPAATGLPVA